MEAVKTNIVGTHHVLEAAGRHNITTTVCLSTDKAVMPVNAMGMTKALMEKVTQAASDTLGAEERNAVEAQLDELAAEIDSIVAQTTYNDVALIDGTYISKQFQIGAETTDTMTVSLSQNHTAASLAVGDSDLVVDSASNSSSALASVNAAIDTVNSTILSVGALGMRLDFKSSALSAIIANTEAAKSQILDADMAKEQLEAVKLQILQQTATASLASANIAPQSVLALF